MIISCSLMSVRSEDVWEVRCAAVGQKSDTESKQGTWTDSLLDETPQVISSSSLRKLVQRQVGACGGR